MRAPRSMRAGRREQERMDALIERAISDDLPGVVDASRLNQFPAGIGGQVDVEVGHLAVGIDEGMGDVGIADTARFGPGARLSGGPVGQPAARAAANGGAAGIAVLVSASSGAAVAASATRARRATVIACSTGTERLPV